MGRCKKSRKSRKSRSCQEAIGHDAATVSKKTVKVRDGYDEQVRQEQQKAVRQAVIWIVAGVISLMVGLFGMKATSFSWSRHSFYLVVILGSVMIAALAGLRWAIKCFIPDLRHAISDEMAWFVLFGYELGMVACLGICGFFFYSASLGEITAFVMLIGVAAVVVGGNKYLIVRTKYSL